MKVRADYIPVTGTSVLTNITIQFDRKDLQFQAEGRDLDRHRQYVRPHHDHVAPLVNVFEDPVVIDSPDRAPRRHGEAVVHLSEIGSAARRACTG